MYGGGRRKIHTKLWSEKSEHMQDLGRDGRMVLIFNFRKKKEGRCGLKSFGSGSRTVVDLCEENNKTSGSIKCWTI
jgi:hypothetical protein